MSSTHGAARNGRVAAITATLALFGAIGGAASEGTNDGFQNGNGLQFSTNATVATDYRYRGFTQTREKSALQGGVNVSWRQFYVGIWATNVDFGRVQDALGRWHDAADYEMVTHVGVKNKIGGFQLDVSASYYAFPGAYGVPPKLDYFEAKAGISREINSSLAADLQIYYSPDYQGETGHNWVFEGGLVRKLSAYGSFTPSLSARLGYSAGDEARGGYDYWYWNAGFSVLFNEYFEFDLRYYDTFGVPTAIAGSCHDRCDGRLVARITFEN
jgi:uncharacterized protein (TIGR02001 family)